MQREYEGYGQLFKELTAYERKGIPLFIEGKHASPMGVVQEMMAREEGSYMRDYELNAKGALETLSFVNINRKEEPCAIAP